ncbi:MAG: hypothetical protein K2M72_06930, partial [Paramuribaculum sp.]|nr:hypothetical protein [Paramuribaculum sp.]
PLKVTDNTIVTTTSSQHHLTPDRERPDKPPPPSRAYLSYAANTLILQRLPLPVLTQLKYLKEASAIISSKHFKLPLRLTIYSFFLFLSNYGYSIICY